MDYRRIDDAVSDLRIVLKEEGLDPEKGLTNGLFTFASSLIPIVNVDLFITDNDGRLLLSWRDDTYFGEGWHIPGGCLRIRETLENRIQKTALMEIGTKVEYEKEPISVREAILQQSRPWLDNRLERSHNISFLYKAWLPDGFEIFNGDKQVHDSGYLQWFDHIPDDLLIAHRELYLDLLQNWEHSQR